MSKPEPSRHGAKLDQLDLADRAHPSSPEGSTSAASRHTSTLSSATERIRATESTYLPDVLIPLSATTWTPNGSLVVPDVGEAIVNEWAREQLFNQLGIRFDRWFQTATPSEQAEEMTRRLRRARNKVRLRLAQGTHGPIVRALVSPTYSAIEDSSLLAAVVGTLEHANPLLHRLEMTNRMTTAVVTIGEPQSHGGIVGAVWGALTITNSGVGWSGLSIILSIIRLVCQNGMSAPIHEGQLIKVRHRALDIGAVHHLLGTRLQEIPALLLRATSTLEASTSWNVIDVAAETRELLRERGMIRSHLPGVRDAFRHEPHKSVFGIAQALTLHAQQVTPEDRLALEQLAGSYVMRSSP